MIVGIVIGCVVVIAAFIVTIVLVVRKKPKDEHSNEEIQVLVENSEE